MASLTENASFKSVSDIRANRTNALDKEGHHGQPPYTQEDLAFCFAYGVIVIIGIIGNSFIITAVRKHRSMHTTTNFLLANIAIADLITMAFCVPYLIIKFFTHPTGSLGKLVCTLVTKNNFTSITLGVSILTLGVLAVERYNALIRPMQHRLRMSKETVLYAVGVIWVLAIIDSLPLLIYTDFDGAKRRCIYTFNGRLYWILIGTAMFGVLVTICYCYFRVLKAIYNKQILGGDYPTQCKMDSLKSKKKLVQLLMTLTIFFVLFFAPRLIFLFFSPMLENQLDVSLFKRLSFFLVICNSCVNPIICVCQSANYRSAFKNMLMKTYGGRRSLRVRIEPEQTQNAFVLQSAQV